MKRIFLGSFLLLAACATRPADRTEAQTNYLSVEQDVQERSRERAERTSRVTALAAQVRALDAQIANQRLVISRWSAMPEVPSAPAMIENAKLRIRQLNSEKEFLVSQQEEELRRVSELRDQSP